MPVTRRKSAASLRLSFEKEEEGSNRRGGKPIQRQRSSGRKSVSPRRSGTLHHPEADDINGEVWIESTRVSQVPPDAPPPSSLNERPTRSSRTRDVEMEQSIVSNVKRGGRKRARAEERDEEMLVGGNEDVEISDLEVVDQVEDPPEYPSSKLLSPFQYMSGARQKISNRPPPPLLRLPETSSNRVLREEAKESPHRRLSKIEKNEAKSGEENDKSNNGGIPTLPKGGRGVSRGSFLNEEESPIRRSSPHRNEISSNSSGTEPLRIRIGVMPLPGAPQGEQAEEESFSEHYLVPRNFFQLPQSSSRSRATNIVGWSGVFPEIQLPSMADWVALEGNQEESFLSSAYRNVVGNHFHSGRYNQTDLGEISEETIVTGSITAILSPSS